MVGRKSKMPITNPGLQDKRTIEGYPNTRQQELLGGGECGLAWTLEKVLGSSSMKTRSKKRRNRNEEGLKTMKRGTC